MNRKMTILVTALLLSATGVTAQNPDARRPGADALARAIVVEEAERDLDEALKLYTSVAEDVEAAGSVRADARLRLARLLLRRGRTTEGRAMMEVVSRGEGVAAQKARSWLENGPSQEDERLVRAIKKALQLLGGSHDDQSKARATLTWIGAPAMPYLEKAVRRDAMDATRMRAYMKAMHRIGGGPFRSFLRGVAASDDVMLRRAVMDGLSPVSLTAAACTEIRRFLEDPDVNVRAAAVTRLIRSSLSSSEIGDLSRDPSPEIRVAAMRGLPWTLNNIDLDEILAKVIEAGLTDPDHGVRLAAAINLPTTAD